MPTLSQVASVTINKQNVFPAQKAFGIPMFVCYQTVKPGIRLQEFAETSEVISAGYTVNHPIYKAAVACFSQSPRPEKLVVGSRFLPFTQVVKFTPLNLTVGFVYAFKARDAAGTETVISYTVQTGDDAADISDGLQVDLDPISGMVSASATGSVTNTSTAGVLIEYYELPSPSDMKVEVTTADPGIATDLAEIKLALEASRGLIDAYGFTLDSCGEAECNAAAAWVEAQKMVFSARNSDSLSCDVATTTDVFSDNVAAARTRTHIIYAQRSIQDYRDLAFLAKFFALNVPEGSASPAYKILAGIEPDALTSAQANAINGKRGSTYTTLNSVNIVFEGKVGDGDWFDTTVNLDWLAARVQEAIFAAQLNAKKIPFTQAGIDIITGIAQAIFNLAVTQGVLAPVDENGEPPTVTAPLLSKTTAAQRAARTLSGIKGRGRLAGAIHRAAFIFDIGV